MKSNELLRRYVDGRSESAFEDLVNQHIDLVYSAALRQVNGDVPTAQDVTQAVFTELARNAPRLTQHTSLAGWLYTTTRYLAAKAVRAEQRRGSHEQEAHEMNQLLQTTNSDSHWQELRPLLDDAMHDLSATDREAVLMRYFERLPLAEIGARVGLKENAVHMRIERAIDRSRAALAKRGVTSTTTALTAVLTGRAVGGAPAGLAKRVSRAAYGAAAAGSVLGWGLLKLAASMKSKLLIAVGGTAVLAGLILLPQLLTKSKEIELSSDVSAATNEQADAPNNPSLPKVAGADDPTSTSRSLASNELVLHIVAADTGKPIAGATVVSWSREKDETNFPLTTNNADSFGVCAIPIPPSAVTLLGIGSRTDGYVDTALAWQPDHGETIPRQYTWRLDGATPIGGQVVDENGNAVAGANVTVSTSRNSASEDSLSPHISTGAMEHTVTDAEGRWSIARFARKAISILNFQVAHPDFVAETGFDFMNDPEVEQSLLAGGYIYKLHRGLSASGIVVDASGQAVSGATVTAISGGHPRVTTNQTDGTFTLNGLSPGLIQINAEAHGFAQTTTNLDLTGNHEALRLELSRGNLLRLRVVDTNGTPVPNAAVSLNFNRVAGNSRFGGNGVLGQFRKQTGADGRITWDSAPDGPLFFGIHAFGYQRAQNVEVTADGEEHLVALHPARTISGSVNDAALHQPIATFRIVMGVVQPRPATGGTRVQWNRSLTFHYGTFSQQENDIFGAVPRQYKFEADGYAPFVTRVVQPDEGDVSFDVLLYPAAGMSITVLSPDGRTATNAFIGLDMPGAHLDLKPGGFDPGPGVGVLSVDDAGRFVVPPDDTVTRVIAASPEGYAESTPTALVASPSMRLQPWGRLEGTYLSGGKPAVGRVLRLRQFDYPRFDRFRFFTAETDGDGHFVFPRVPPGQFNLFRIEKQETIRGTAYRFSPVQNPALTVRLGETMTVPLVLYKVTARLSLPPGVEMETNWNMSAVAANTQEVAGEQVSEPLKEYGDGMWVAEDLPAGDYTLEASVLDPAPSGGDAKAHMHAMMSFTVPGNPPNGTLELGSIVLQPVQ